MVIERFFFGKRKIDHCRESEWTSWTCAKITWREVFFNTLTGLFNMHQSKKWHVNSSVTPYNETRVTWDVAIVIQCRWQWCTASAWPADMMVIIEIFFASFNAQGKKNQTPYGHPAHNIQIKVRYCVRKCLNKSPWSVDHRVSLG